MFQRLFTILAFAAGIGFANSIVAVGAEADAIPQKEFILENEFARLKAVDFPGGAVTEFTNKKTGVNHVAGEVKPEIADSHMGWTDFNRDNPTDRREKAIYNQKYEVVKRANEDGSHSLVMTGKTAELAIERILTLAKDSNQLRVDIKLTNIHSEPRALQIRWHPMLMGSGDLRGTNGCVLFAGDDFSVRKILIGTGWDNWFEASSNSFGAIADFKSGEGVIFTYDPKSVPVLMTWTIYNQNSPTRGAVCVEPYAHPVIKKPGESISLSFTYLPFSADTDFSKIPTGLLEAPALKKNLHAFAKNALTKSHMAEFGAYTFARSEFFDWQHRRRDVFGLTENCFADCAVVAYPKQDYPLKVRMTGGIFSDNPEIAKRTTWPWTIRFNVTVSDSRRSYYSNDFNMDVNTGVEGRETFDREFAVPLSEIPDGEYKLAVTAYDPVTRKAFHSYSRTVQVFGNRLAETQKNFQPKQIEYPEYPQVKFSSARTEIPIRLDFADNRETAPVQLGIPLPEKAFYPDKCGMILTNQSGKTLPADLSVMNVWPDGSLKWILASFRAQPNDKVVFKIGTEVKSVKNGTPIVSEDAALFRISTGKISGTVDKQTGKVDLTLNGVAFPVPGEAWWKGGDGKVSAFAMAGKPSGIFRPGVSLESNGCESAVLKIQGWFGNMAEGNPAYGELRIVFHRDLPFYKTYFTVTYTGNPYADTLASYGLTFRNAGADAVISDGSVKTGNASLTLVNYINMLPKKWTADSKNGTVSLHAWPESAGIHSFAPVFEYWLPSSSSSEACGTGASRTLEIVVDGGTKLDHENEVYANTPPQWVKDTKVLQNLSPADMKDGADIEEFLDTYIDFQNTAREIFKFNGHWQYGTLHNVFQPATQDWLIAGRYPNIGNEQDIVQAPWLLYFRSGERKYRKFAELWTRHLMEVQSIRWHNLYPEAAGMSRRHHYTPWLGNADYGHTMLCPYLEYYHATGYAPAWEMAQMTAEGMKLCKEGTWRYINNPLVGLSRMYLETGRKDYKEHADRIWNDLCKGARNQWYGGDHGARAARWYSELNPGILEEWIALSHGIPNSKDMYSNMSYTDSLGALYEKTGDIWYAMMARLVFDNCRRDMLRGSNPLYRGLYHGGNATQHGMAVVRQAPNGKDAIVAARKAIPATFCNLSNTKEIIIRKNSDQDIRVTLSSANLTGAEKIKVLDSNGKNAKFTAKEIFTPLAPGRKNAMFPFFEITVPKDGNASGEYRIPVGSVLYLGSNMKDICIRAQAASGAQAAMNGDPLYLNVAGFKGKEFSVITGLNPVFSLELFDMQGRVLFSKTAAEDGQNSVRHVTKVKLPEKGFIRIGDRQGYAFEGVKEVDFYLEPQE